MGVVGRTQLILGHRLTPPSGRGILAPKWAMAHRGRAAWDANCQHSSPGPDTFDATGCGKGYAMMALVARASSETEYPIWLTAFAGPLLVALVGGILGGSLLVYVLQRHHGEQARRREAYADAVAALVAWHEYPYRVRRRTSDSADTLNRLVVLGHELQEALQRSLAWMAADSKSLYESFQAISREISADVGSAIKNAWESEPIAVPAEMNLGDWGPSSIDAQIQGFLQNLPKGLK